MVKSISMAMGDTVKNHLRPTTSRTGKVADGATERDDEWEAIRCDLERAYGGPLSLDAEDLQMLRDICLEAKRQHGSRSDAMRVRELIR